MADLDCDWQGDLRLTPAGDLALVEGIDLDNQHIVRRLLTPVREYVFAPEYGAGLPQRIGRTALDRGIKAIVRSQLALEATVAPLPLPKIDVQFRADGDGLCTIRIDYTNAVSDTQESIALEFPTAR